MSEAKKKLGNYDPTLALGEDMVLSVPFFYKEGGEERSFMLSASEVAKHSEEGLKHRLSQVAYAQKWAEDYITNIKAEVLEADAQETVENAYRGVFSVTMINCTNIYLERLREDTGEAKGERPLVQELERLGYSLKDVMSCIDEASESLCKKWVQEFSPEDQRALARYIRTFYTINSLIDIYLRTDDEVGPDASEGIWFQTFKENYQNFPVEKQVNIRNQFIDKEVYSILEEDLKPIEMPLGELRRHTAVRWLEKKLDLKGFESAIDDLPPTLAIGTDKIFAHQNTFLSRKSDEPVVEVLKTRKNNLGMRLSARSRLEIAQDAGRPSGLDYIEKMTTTLRKNKANSSSLIKTHLYMVDQACKQGGSNPTFVLDIDDLLEAKGHNRRADGHFHPDAYRGEWGRIATLASCWIELQEVTSGKGRGKKRAFIDAPYWQIEARYRIEDGEEITVQALSLDEPGTPIIKKALVRPGVWWAMSDIWSKRFEVPRQILALDKSGKNETERYALQLAVTLSLWVRSSQEQHAGRTWGYSVGKLLEASGLKTRDEFDAMRAAHRGRVREYLAGVDGPLLDGALRLLATECGFDIRIRDQNEFWADGRNWGDKFWEAKLDVYVPDLKVKKSGIKSTKQKISS